MSENENDIPVKKMIALWKLCQKFVKEQDISCPEAICQCDRVIENSYDFIEEIADIIGYNTEESESD